MPARSRSRGLARLMSRASRRTVPVAGRSPISASHSSVCPLPCTPAMPRISPARTWNETRPPRSGSRPPRAGVLGRDGQLADVQHDVAGPGRFLADPQLHRPADHQRGQLGVGGGRRPLADHLAAPDHRDAVGDGLHLLELVRDEDDGPAARAQLSHDPEQVLGLAGSQHRGRLVQDQHAGLAQQRLDDLHPLLHADRQVLDQGVRVHLQPVPLGQLPDLAAGPPAVEQARAAGGLHAEHDVLRDGEHRHQHEVLVHHADPGADRVLGRPDRDGLAVDAGSLPRRAGPARRGCSSAWSCRPRSRRAGRGSRPGATLRSMWSLATRLPKRFVMPRSSSSTPVLCWCSRRRRLPPRRCRPAGAAPVASMRPRLGRPRGPAQPGPPVTPGSWWPARSCR